MKNLTAREFVCFVITAGVGALFVFMAFAYQPAEDRADRAERKLKDFCGQQSLQITQLRSSMKIPNANATDLFLGAIPYARAAVELCTGKVPDDDIDVAAVRGNTQALDQYLDDLSKKLK